MTLLDDLSYLEVADIYTYVCDTPLDFLQVQMTKVNYVTSAPSLRTSTGAVSWSTATQLGDSRTAARRFQGCASLVSHEGKVLKLT